MFVDNKVKFLKKRIRSDGQAFPNRQDGIVLFVKQIL